MIFQIIVFWENYCHTNPYMSVVNGSPGSSALVPHVPHQLPPVPVGPGHDFSSKKYLFYINIYKYIYFSPTRTWWPPGPRCWGSSRGGRWRTPGWRGGPPAPPGHRWLQLLFYLYIYLFIYLFFIGPTKKVVKNRYGNTFFALVSRLVPPPL